MYCLVQSTTGNRIVVPGHVRRLLVPAEVVGEVTRELEALIRHLRTLTASARASIRLGPVSHRGGRIRAAAAPRVARRCISQIPSSLMRKKRGRLRVVGTACRAADNVDEGRPELVAAIGALQTGRHA